jgi:hypothetical protein
MDLPNLVTCATLFNSGISRKGCCQLCHEDDLHGHPLLEADGNTECKIGLPESARAFVDNTYASLCCDVYNEVSEFMVLPCFWLFAGKERWSPCLKSN